MGEPQNHSNVIWKPLLSHLQSFQLRKRLHSRVRWCLSGLSRLTMTYYAKIVLENSLSQLLKNRQLMCQQSRQVLAIAGPQMIGEVIIGVLLGLEHTAGTTHSGHPVKNE